MTTGDNYLLLELLRALKEQQTLASAYKSILVAVMEATRVAPGLQGPLSQEVARVRASLQGTIDAEYLELERALLDDTDVRQRLLDLARLHQS